MEREQADALFDQGREAVVRELTRLAAVAAEASAAVALLTERLADLERQLGMNSRNSSKPPSSDGIARPVKSSRSFKRGQRKPGKQKGSPGAHRAQVDDPDDTVTHDPEECRKCGGDLSDAPVVDEVVRQVADTPPHKLWWEEHRARRKRCGCGCVTTAEFPPGVTAPVVYGPRLTAIAAYQSVYQVLPVKRGSEQLSDLLGANVSTGWVDSAIRRAAEAVRPAVDRIRGGLRCSPVAHFDETSIRIGGVNHWTHVASTDMLTLLTVSASRGEVGMREGGVLEHFRGIAMHDGLTTYEIFNCQHALCNAHHLRRLIGVYELDGEHWAWQMIDLLLRMLSAVERARFRDQHDLPPQTLSRYRNQYDTILQTARLLHPPRPPGPRCKRADGANLLDTLEDHADEVLRFAYDFNVPFDNNLAERDLRMLKVKQRVSGTFRAQDTARDHATIRSYVSTARKQGQDVLHVLEVALRGTPWLPATQPGT